MRMHALKTCSFVVAISLLLPPNLALSQQTAPAGQMAPATAADPDSADTFNPEQLDALLAPIALYPDALLAQTLMASTAPLDIVAASRWLEQPANKALSGDALAAAMQKQTWDPAVVSLVPFPQVLAMMNGQLDWTKQLGYAMAEQQGDVMDSVQRLRLQAQQAGTLQTNEQQVVSTQAVLDDEGGPTPQQTIVIQPANPQIVYVPTYNPTQVYGAWPYPAYPPVYLPPPPGYYAGTALVSGLAFGVGVAVVGSMWGWATPSWGRGNVNVNVNRYNSISRTNVHHSSFNGNTWNPPRQNNVNGARRAPNGPVHTPARANGLPANAVGRPSVKVPSTAVNRANIGKGGNTANIGQVNIGGGNTNNRVNAGNNVGGNAGLSRPNAGTNAGGVRPNPQRNGGTPPTRPSAPAAAAKRPAAATRPQASALSGVNNGRRDNQAQARGAQSRAVQQNRPAASASRSGASRPSGGARRPGGRG